MNRYLARLVYHIRVEEHVWVVAKDEHEAKAMAEQQAYEETMLENLDAAPNVTYVEVKVEEKHKNVLADSEDSE